jgi:hypothetical protein
MRLALARHDALLRAAIETEGGCVLKTVGDAFCAAFPAASGRGGCHARRPRGCRCLAGRPEDASGAGHCRCRARKLNQANRSASGPQGERSSGREGSFEIGEVPSGFGIVGRPGFQGYIEVDRDFPPAHGYGLLTDGLIGVARVGTALPALVLDPKRPAAGVESVGQSRPSLGGGLRSCYWPDRRRWCGRTSDGGLRRVLRLERGRRAAR